MATRTLPPGARTATRALGGAEDVYCVEYAKSGRSKCTECSKGIEDKALRLGVGYTYGGKLSWRWQHWPCVTAGTLYRIGTAEKLQGLESLSPQDQGAVRQRFAGPGKAPRKKVHTLFG